MTENIQDILNREDTVEATDRFPCKYRGEAKRVHKCKPCNGTRTGLVYECEVHGECTVLAYQAKGKNRRRLKVCLACKERTAPQNVNISAERVKANNVVYDCRFFGKPNVKRKQHGVTLIRYECLHPDVKLSTVPSECDMCSLKETYGITVNTGQVIPKKEKRKKPKEYLRHNHKSPFISTNGLPLYMNNRFQNSPCFIVAGGPSSKSLDLTRLSQDGIFSIAINNAAIMFSPTCFIHGDPPEKFHDRIWKNPNVMKFVPRTMLEKKTRYRNERGILRAETPVKTHPNVIGYHRETNFNPKNFLRNRNISFGNSKKSAKKNGYPRVLSTFFSAIKMAYALGSRQIFLVGVDFNMNSSSPYAFNETKHAAGVSGNNSSYRKIYEMVRLLVPHFDAHSLSIFNCNPNSGLDLFPFISYEDALQSVLHEYPTDRNAEGWYDKTDK
jgi:hypothetical protein